MNKILKGNCIETLQTLPDGCVNTCITSPPYYGLRDYGEEGQHGLEKTPEEYVEKMVDVFREVRRVLRDDGTVWLNLGDSYCNPSQPGGGDPTIGKRNIGKSKYKSNMPPGLKPKDLIGIPWRVAFALQADGWYLRQDIIWHKPNPMPESVTDRCTKAHEYIFLLSKSQKYYYDNEAVKEDSIDKESYTGRRKRNAPTMALHDFKNLKNSGSILSDGTLTSGQVYEKRNKRSVWTVNLKSYKGAHFATFPPDLIQPCVLAGCPEGGVILDPYGGSGTTAEVALKNNRQFILCELSESYIDLIKIRINPLLEQGKLFDS